MSAAGVTAEQVTRRFSQRFLRIRVSFLAAFQEIEEVEARQAYISLLLNRLLFVFFLQQKGLLDDDKEYLSHRLHSIQTRFGPDTFFRTFLLPFFYEGLSSLQRTPAQIALFGSIPYLGKDLFLPHPLEKASLQFVIADEAFSSLFAFAAAYDWCLDESRVLTEKTIIPALLGHIFEISLHQQEMGAYYTPEDVTEYIARNTLIPYLFADVAQDLPEAFTPEGPIWSHGHFTCGPLASIEDCITYNLDSLSFLQDTLLHMTSAKLLLRFYQSLEKIRILDPTCGAGAFLFAAVAILVPLYEACLTRMQMQYTEGEAKELFRKILLPIAASSNLRAFVLRSILTNNLYGVDLMPEAIEICKLRFSLLLLAEGIAPEHLTSFSTLSAHLRSGNALVGFSSIASLPLSNQARIEPYAMDTNTLDWLLAEEYGTASKEEHLFSRWRSRHQPFHWFIAFPEVMTQGGFSIIIGNPPYVEYDAHIFPYILRNFLTLPCGNLYPCVIERSYHLLSRHGQIGMILPLAAFATRNMLPLLQGIRTWFSGTWVSFYHFRPAMLFSGGKIASIPTLILLGHLDGQERRFSTPLLKWGKEQRGSLFSTISYCRVTVPTDPVNPHYYPKFGVSYENSIMEKVLRHPCIRDYLAASPNQNRIFYRSAGGLYWKIFLNFPWPYHTTSNKQCSFQPMYDRDIFVALLNSSLFWWYYTVTFDSFNLKDYMLFGFRFSYPDDSVVIDQLKRLCQQLMTDFCLNAQHRKRSGKDSYTVYVKKSKPLLDEIDCILAQLYDFTHEEYIFLISYDLKYRLGLSS